MKKRGSLFAASRSLLLLFALVGGLNLRGETLVLSLDDVFERIEKENLTVLLNKEFVVQSMENARQERGNLYPFVSFDASQGRTKAPPGDFGSRFPPFNQGVAGLSANFSLLDPTLLATYEAAKRGVKVSEKNLEVVLQEILNAVGGVFFAHLRNEDRFKVIEANIERASALLELAQSRLDAGVTTQIDVTRAETRVAIEQQAKLQQETVVFNSELLLKQILNLDFEEELVLEAPTISSEASEKKTISFETIQQKRSDFQREVFLLEQNNLEQRAANWQRFPSIKLFGGYGYGTEVLLDGNEQDTWNVGISLSIPIFEGFKIESRKQFVKSRIRAQKHVISDLKNKISAEVRLAIQDSKSRGLQIAVAQKQKNLAEEELELARIRYEEGVADNREVIDAQNNLAKAEDNLVDGVYLYNLALIELARAKGDVRNILRDR